MFYSALWNACLHFAPHSPWPIYGSPLGFLTGLVTFSWFGARRPLRDRVGILEKKTDVTFTSGFVDRSRTLRMSHWVRSGNTQSEHSESALPPKADK